MCGLIGAFSTGKEAASVNEWALLQFEDQMKRGLDGFGIIKIMDDLSVKIDRATEPYKFLFDIHQDQTNRIIVHHRQPTSTDNIISQTHPISVSNGSLAHDYLVIHNGIISNDDELKTEHESLGFVYSTVMEDDIYSNLDKFNDSESFAIELARYIEEQTDRLNIKGSASFIALKINKKTQKAESLYFGRSGSSPLRMTKTRNNLFLASEHIGNEIKEGMLYSCKLDDEMKLTKKSLRIPKEESECSFSLKGSGGRMYQPYKYKDDGYGLIRKDTDDLDLQEEFSEDIQVILDEFMTHAEWEKGIIEDDIKQYTKRIEERMAAFNKKMTEEGFKESLGLGYHGGAFREGKKISVPKLE